MIFEQVSLKIADPSQIYALTGASGSGKTTLFNILFGLDKDYHGNYQLFGHPAKELTLKEWSHIREQKMRMVFQDNQLIESLTVYQQLFLTGSYNKGQIEDVLRELDLLELKEYQISKLSGGQKQRVGIARAILAEPQILLLDEPTGNLDGLSIQRLMKYLDRLRLKGILIIVITHEAQICELADVVYELAERKIILKKSEIAPQAKLICPSKAEQLSGATNKKHLFLYPLTMAQKNCKKLFFLGIPSVLLMSMFMLAFTAFKGSSLDSIKRLFQGMGETTIVLDTQNLKMDVIREHNQKNIVTSFDGQRIGFSLQDVEGVKAIPRIKNTVLVSDIVSNYDQEGHSFNQTFSNKYVKRILQGTLGSGKNTKKILVHFAKSRIPKKFSTVYNVDDLTFLAGGFPSDGSQELLLPDIYLSLTTQPTKAAEFIGKELVLDVQTQTGEAKQASYTVGGIYQTNYQVALAEEYPIYTSYFEEDEQKNYLTSDSFEFYQKVLTETPESQRFNQKIIATYEDYQAAVGTGLMRMVIEVEQNKDVKEVTTALEQRFPSYQILSQENLKNGEIGQLYKKLTEKLLSGSTVIALLAGLVVVFINKSYSHHRSREFAILYSLGFQRQQLYQMIILERGLFFLICFSLSLGIIRLADNFYFSQTRQFILFKDMFSLTNLLALLGLMLLMELVSVVWGLSEVKQKRLKNYLNAG